MTASATPISFPMVNLRISAPGRTTELSAPFELIPTARKIANTKEIPIGPVRAGDEVVVEFLSWKGREAVATATIVVPGDGHGVIRPGGLSIEVEAAPCCDCECCRDEEDDD